MVGRKLPLTDKDKRVLYVFFTKPNDGNNGDNDPTDPIGTTGNNENYLKLLDTWKSTNLICKELNESSDKILKNLKKLYGFHLIFALSILHHDNEIDHYWAINREGVYYILSTLERDEQSFFLNSNKDKIKEFSDILTLFQRNDVQVSYLTRRIKDIVENYQFDLLESFIEDWRRTNVSGQHAMLRFFSPSRKKILEKYSSKKAEEKPKKDEKKEEKKVEEKPKKEESEEEKKDKIKNYDWYVEKKDLPTKSLN